MDLLKIGKEFIKGIESLGYEAYIVGGSPRDILMGVDSNDVDIATNCPIELLDKKFNTHDIGKSRDFGILSIVYKDETFEVAQFRTESAYDGVRPGKVNIVGSLKEDVQRRDFTINALAMNADLKIIDFPEIDGLGDIKRKLIRAVGNPVERFKEDHVRMLRAARFGSMDGFTIERNTRLAIRRSYKLINAVTPERIGLELYKAAKLPGPQFAKFILLLDQLKLLGQILPEVLTMKYFQHDMVHHPEGPTVFDHTIKCLEIMENMDPLSKLAALFHDIGKCVTASADKYGWKMTYYNHASPGARMAVDIMRRYKFSEFQIESVEYAVRNHMKLHNVVEMKPSKVFHMVNSPYFNTLIDVGWADEYSRGTTFAYYGDFEKKLEKIIDIQNKWKDRVVNNTIKILDGKRIIELLSIKSGPEVGKIKREIEEHIIDNELEPTDDLIDELILKYKE